MPKNRTRGFIIVIILGALAVIAAVVAAQLMTSQKASITGVRAKEEVAARALAEACLDEMTEYAQNEIPLPSQTTDFDRLLSHDGTMGNGDDYMPGLGGTVIQIPPGTADNEHKWEIVDIRSDAAGTLANGLKGMCAVRFDDNSDDARPDLPGSGTADKPGEGGGADVNNADRDMAVYVTVIGLFPATNASTAYLDAHARVTLRRLIAKPNVLVRLQAAIRANNVDIQNNARICGAGGVEVAGTFTSGNNDCVCGDHSTSCTGSGCTPPGGTCACPGGACTAASTSPPLGAPPPVNIHWSNQSSFLAKDVLGAPPRVLPSAAIASGQGSSGEPAVPYEPPGLFDSNGDGTPDAPACMLEGERVLTGEEHIFVWDNKDTTAEATLAGFGNTVVELPAATTTDCTAPQTDPMPAPCSWTSFGATVVTCNLPAQSPCWKLVARIDGGVATHAPVGGAGTIQGWNEGDEFHPRRATAIPNVAGGRQWGQGASPLLCGKTASCQNCLTTNTGPNPGGNFFRLGESSDHWHFEEGATNRDGPVPSILFFKALPNPRVHIKHAGDGASGALNVSIVTSGNIDLDDGGICCATCNCTLMATNNQIANCQPDSILGGAATPGLRTNNPGDVNYTNAAPVPPPPFNYGQVGGIAMKALGRIDVGASKDFIGDIRGNIVDIPGDNCIDGSVIGYDGPGGLNCDTTAPCGDSSVCFGNNAHVVGDVHSMSDIIFKNNPLLFGDIAAKSDVCIKNNAKLEGTITAGNSVELKNNPTIVNSTTVSAGAPTTANPALTSFMEASW